MLNPYPLPHNMRPALKEIKQDPFFQKSKDSLRMPDELRCEAKKKHDYLKAHLDNMMNYLASFKVGQPFEKVEHGKMAFGGRKTEWRNLNARRYAGIINEINLIKPEVDRLQAILTA